MEKIQLLQFIRNKYTISNQRAEKISSIFNFHIAKKNTILLNQGEICHFIYFVNKGAIRAFTCNEKSREYTRVIAVENNFLSNLSSFKNLKESDEYIETLEETEFIYTDRSKLYGIIKEDPLLKDIYIEILEEFNIININKINRILSLNDFEKVLYLFENHKEFIKRFPDRINASFLNMSRENFSRYKKLGNV